MHVLRVDLLTEPGQALARRYEPRLTPTLLLLDDRGELQFRHDGAIRDQRAFRRAIERAIAPS